MLDDRADEMLRDPHVREVNLNAIEQVTATGGQVYFKWTCGGCGERALANNPNSLHTSFKHEECGYTTRTEDGDLGFLLMFGTS